MAKINYTCECCGEEFTQRKLSSGEHLCVNCIEIRRHLRRFVKERGLTVGQVLTRAGKLLLSDAQKEAKLEVEVSKD